MAFDFRCTPRLKIAAIGALLSRRVEEQAADDGVDAGQVGHLDQHVPATFHCRYTPPPNDEIVSVSSTAPVAR